MALRLVDLAAWQVIVREKEVSMATQGATTVKGLVTLKQSGILTNQNRMMREGKSNIDLASNMIVL